MRICITGRSHMVALKNAVDEGKFDPARHDLVFAGASNQLYKDKVQLENGVLVPQGKASEMFRFTSDGACDRVDPKAFDAVVLYGSYYHLQSLFSSFFRTGPLTATTYSRDFLYRGAQEWLAAQVTLRTIHEMRARSPETRIMLVFEPFYSERHKVRMPEGAEIPLPLRDTILSALADLVEAEGAQCLFQPEETIVHAVYSRDDLSVGSKRLTSSEDDLQSSDDVTHLNSTYGAIILQKILSALA